MTSTEDKPVVQSEATEDKPIASIGSTGIRLLSIFVDKIDYTLNLADENAGVGLTSEIEILSEQQIDHPFGFVRLTISCSSKSAKSRGHNLQARMIGSFKQIGETTSVPFEKYLAFNAPASMFAFARELIYSITSRAPIPPILLDPVNMMELMKTGSLKYSIVPDNNE